MLFFLEIWDWEDLEGAGGDQDLGLVNHGSLVNPKRVQATKGGEEGVAVCALGC